MAICPPSFCCPITGERKSEKVFGDPEGNTYEKHAIEEWLQRNATSPLTRNRLTVAMLQPNRALGAAIAEFFQHATNHSPPDAPASAEEPEQVVGVSLQHFCLAERGSDLGVEVLIDPPVGTAATPLDVCVVVDISGSMSSAATVQQNGQQVDMGFSVLDVTKHAVKTVIASLRPTDRLTIVTFSTNAHCKMDWMRMTPENQAHASSLIDRLNTEGATNLWDGLRLALWQFQASPRPGCLSSLLLLTDGEPSPHLMPPRGIVPMLQRELEKMTEAGTCVPVINTFGFGYRLDTKVLVDIASKGNGAFSFIPDSGFVGTVLIHSLASTATTLGKFARLTMEASGGAKLSLVHGDSNDVLSSSSDTLSLTLDSINYGQARRVLVSVKLPDGTQVQDAGEYMTARLLFTNAQGKTVSETRCASSELLGPVTNAAATDPQLQQTMLRLEFVTLLASLLPDSPAALFTLAEKQAGIKAFVDNHHALRGHGILKDTESQVSLAVASADAWQRWGLNYVCSLLSAHRQERCNNFKDESIAVYGGALFRQERDRAEDIFSSLPPPIPSCAVNGEGRRGSGMSSSGISSAQAPQFQQLFNHVSNGCFHPSCLVSLADGSQKRISELVKGDRLARPDVAGAGIAPTVVCVVQTDTNGGVEELVSLNQGALVLTPWHPIWDRGRWAFPHDLSPPQQQQCTSVWNLVLDSCHMIDIGGVACVTLAHGFRDDAVVQHSYFGTDRVLRDLQAQPGGGFARGHLRFACGSIARGPDGCLLGYQSAKLLPAHSG
jgi:hypothetical protein